MSKNNIPRASRIRILISGCLPPPVGGMATYFETLINSSLTNYVDFRFVETSTHKREFAKSGRASFSNAFEAIRDWIRYTKALGTYHPHITHIGTAFGLSFIKHSYCVIISRIFRKKVLLHPHCSLSKIYHEQPSLWKWFFRSIIKLTDGVIVLSNEWLELQKIVPGCRVFHLINAVKLDDFSSASQKHNFLEGQKDDLTALYLGYLGKAKGTFDLLETASLLKKDEVNLHFNLVGSELSPGEMDLLNKKIIESGINENVKLKGPAYNEEKIAFFRDADLFIYPSYHEGVPIAVLEAMASGLPIIATRVGGLPDIVQDGLNGILVDPGNPEQLVAAIKKVIADPSLRKSMGMNGYNSVQKNYSLDQHVSKLVEIYNSALKIITDG